MSWYKCTEREQVRVQMWNFVIKSKIIESTTDRYECTIRGNIILAQCPILFISHQSIAISCTKTTSSLFCRLNSGNLFATNWITFMSDTTADVTIPAAAVCGLFTQRTTTRSRWNWHRFACMKQMQRSKPRAAVNSTNSVIQNYLSFQMHNHLCVGELSISQSTFYNCSISQYICPLIFK